MTVKSKKTAPDRPDGPPLALERFLPYRLNVVAEGVSRALSRLYAERHDIGIPEWRVIATLGQYRRMTARDIGAHSRMHKTKVSRAVAVLEDRGLVRREHNQADLREAFLTLTGTGRAVYLDLAPRALAFERALDDALGRRARARLDEALRRLEERARQLDDQETDDQLA